MSDKPLPEKDFIEWLHKLKKSIKSGTGADISEATRMVLSFAAIINGYREEFWGSIDKVGLAEVFLSAIDRVDEIITSGVFTANETPSRYSVYKENIKARYDTLISMCFPKEKPDESAG